MAISSGVRPLRAWIEAGGQRWPIVEGEANLAATRQSSTFSAHLPMSLDGAESAFANVDSLDASLLVDIGGGPQTLVTGELDSADFSYAERMIAVSGRCKSFKLHEKKTNDRWLNKTPGDVIEDLAQRAGLQVDMQVQSSLKAGRVWNKDWVKLTDNVSYAAAIHKMAEALGARWWVDANGQMVVADRNTGGVYTVYYQDYGVGPIVSDALDLRVHKNYQAGKTIKVKVKSWNQKEKKVYSGEKSVDGSGGELEYEYHIPSLTQEHVDKYAENKAREHARHRVQVSVVCAGDPSCNAGMQLQLNGTPFSDTYDIDSVDHAFGMSGYTMTINTRSAGESQ